MDVTDMESVAYSGEDIPTLKEWKVYIANDFDGELALRVCHGS